MVYGQVKPRLGFEVFWPLVVIFFLCFSCSNNKTLYQLSFHFLLLTELTLSNHTHAPSTSGCCLIILLPFFLFVPLLSVCFQSHTRIVHKPVLLHTRHGSSLTLTQCLFSAFLLTLFIHTRPSFLHTRHGQSLNLLFKLLLIIRKPTKHRYHPSHSLRPFALPPPASPSLILLLLPLRLRFGIGIGVRAAGGVHFRVPYHYY